MKLSKHKQKQKHKQKHKHKQIYIFSLYNKYKKRENLSIINKNN